MKTNVIRHKTTEPISFDRKYDFLVNNAVDERPTLDNMEQWFFENIFCIFEFECCTKSTPYVDDLLFPKIECHFVLNNGCRVVHSHPNTKLPLAVKSNKIFIHCNKPNKENLANYFMVLPAFSLDYAFDFYLHLFLSKNKETKPCVSKKSIKIINYMNIILSRQKFLIKDIPTYRDTVLLNIAASLLEVNVLAEENEYNILFGTILTYIMETFYDVDQKPEINILELSFIHNNQFNNNLLYPLSSLTNISIAKMLAVFLLLKRTFMFKDNLTTNNKLNEIRQKFIERQINDYIIPKFIDRWIKNSIAQTCSFYRIKDPEVSITILDTLRDFICSLLVKFNGENSFSDVEADIKNKTVTFAQSYKKSHSNIMYEALKCMITRTTTQNSLISMVDDLTIFIERCYLDSIYNEKNDNVPLIYNVLPALTNVIRGNIL